MSDFVSGFWGVYVGVITIISILACAVLLWMNSSRRSAAASESGADTVTELHGHVWDEDLQEYNNPLPRWWMWLFYITIVFGLAYLVVYPGVGTYAGISGWTSSGQYNEEVAEVNAQYAPLFDKFLQQDLKEVATDPAAKQAGERLFLTYCSQCHGSDARGAKGFPNLTDKDWLSAGDPATVKATIMEGRVSIMPPMAAALGGDGVKDVAHYVRSLSGLTVDSIRVQRGKPLFHANCAACHGSEGKGMPALGAPNLTDAVWLYGGSEATIMETMTKGRSNQMPRFKEFLGEAKVHLLAAYVYGLSADSAGTNAKTP